MRVQFETGVDDLVDVNMRFIGSSKLRSRQRNRAVRNAALSFAGSMLVVSALIVGARSAPVLLVLALLSAVFGICFGFMYRSSYDARVRRAVREAIEEQLGQGRTWVCEIELRPDAAWCRSHGLELTLPWSEALGVEDLEDGVLLKFRAGIIFARNRAFKTTDDRGELIQLSRVAQPA